MFKIALGVIIGVTMGSAAFEIISRKSPKIIRDTEEKAKKMVGTFVESFKAGYASVDKNTEVGSR